MLKFRLHACISFYFELKVSPYCYLATRSVLSNHYFKIRVIFLTGNKQKHKTGTKRIQLFTGIKKFRLSTSAFYYRLSQSAALQRRFFDSRRLSLNHCVQRVFSPLVKKASTKKVFWGSLVTRTPYTFQEKNMKFQFVISGCFASLLVKQFSIVGDYR